MLDTTFDRVPGDIGHASSWPFPTLVEVVRGATAQRVIKDSARGLLPAFQQAGQRLVDRGAAAITTSCGFLALFQRELTRCLPVPVATTALLQIAPLQALLPAGRRVGVITADGSALGVDHFLAAQAPIDTPFVGLPEGGHLHRALVSGASDHFDIHLASSEVIEAGHRLCSAHPEIGAIVLECTNLPPYASALQAALSLPVYDIGSLLCWVHSGLQPRRFC